MTMVAELPLNDDYKVIYLGHVTLSSLQDSVLFSRRFKVVICSRNVLFLSARPPSLNTREPQCAFSRIVGDLRLGGGG
jgi:hypothetical protein